MRYFLFNAALPLKYFSCGNLISREDFLHNRRNIDVNVLIMVREGTLHISQSGKNYSLGPMQYILLPANEEHYGFRASSGKLSYMWVHFLFQDEITVISKESALDTRLDEIIADPSHSHYILPESGEISVAQRAPLLFNQLLDLTRQELICSTLIIEYALSLLLLEISQEFIEKHYNLKNNISLNVARIMEWVKANYYQAISTKEIADQFGYNPDYLSSLFTKSTGTTLTNYINRTRIDISKTLIVNNDVSIKEAAFSCGYSDEKYFMKMFKKQEGMTPTQYKKAFSRKMFNNQKP